MIIVDNHHVSLKRKILTTNQTYQWHLCLGHINQNMIQRLVKFGALHSLVLKDLLVCKSCIEDKMTKRPFPSEGVRGKEYLCILTCVDLLMFKHVESMSRSSLSLMIILGMIMFTLCIENSMP